MLDAAHGQGVGTVRVVQRVDVARSEVQEARVDAAGRVGRRGPIVALRADVRQGSRRVVAVARGRATSAKAIAGMNNKEERFR